MDNFSLFLSYVMPIGYVAEDLRSLMVKGVAVGLSSRLIALIAIAGLFFLLAMIGLKRNVGSTEIRMEPADS